MFLAIRRFWKSANSCIALAVGHYCKSYWRSQWCWCRYRMRIVLHREDWNLRVSCFFFFNSPNISPSPHPMQNSCKAFIATLWRTSSVKLTTDAMSVAQNVFDPIHTSGGGATEMAISTGLQTSRGSLAWKDGLIEPSLIRWRWLSEHEYRIAEEMQYQNWRCVLSIVKLFLKQNILGVRTRGCEHIYRKCCRHEDKSASIRWSQVKQRD